MGTTKRRKSKAGKELETKMAERDETRRESEVTLQKEANQDIQTGTNDATHPGINWGASYTTRHKPRPTNPSSKQNENEHSDSSQ